jgi:hypothetical protein
MNFYQKMLQSEIGRAYARLTVTAVVRHGKRWAARCQCECGNTTGPTLFKHLRNGHSRSCGCAQREAVRATGLVSRHGHARRTGHDPTYAAWLAMRARCKSVELKKRKYYLDAGVRVCKRWDKYENFLADMGPKPKGLTLDRINPLGNYTPGNCRWATWTEQRRNQRRIEVQ